MFRTILIEEVESVVEGLSYEDKTRILANVLFQVFGVDTVLDPERDPQSIDPVALRDCLRDEIWPEYVSENDEDGA